MMITISYQCVLLLSTHDHLEHCKVFHELCVTCPYLTRRMTKLKRGLNSDGRWETKLIIFKENKIGSGHWKIKRGNI